MLKTALVSISGPASVIEGETTTPLYTVSISQAPTTDLTVSLHIVVLQLMEQTSGVASVVIKAGTTLQHLQLQHLMIT